MGTPESSPNLGEPEKSRFRFTRPLLNSLNQHKEILLTIGLVVGVAALPWVLGNIYHDEQILALTPKFLIIAGTALVLAMPLAYLSARVSKKN